MKIFFLFAMGFGAFGVMQGLSGNLDTGAYFLALGAFNFCIYLNESKQSRPKHELNINLTRCPHGYEDWNECPDCCH